MSNDATNNALLQSGVNHIPALILSLLIGPRWNEFLFAVIEDTRFPKLSAFKQQNKSKTIQSFIFFTFSKETIDDFAWHV